MWAPWGGAAVLAPPHFQTRPVPFPPSSFPFLLPFSVKSSVALLFPCVASATRAETSSVLASSKPQLPVRPVPLCSDPRSSRPWRCWEGPCFSEGKGEPGSKPPSSQTARCPAWGPARRPPRPVSPSPFLRLGFLFPHFPFQLLLVRGTELPAWLFSCVWGNTVGSLLWRLYAAWPAAPFLRLLTRF